MKFIVAFFLFIVWHTVNSTELDSTELKSSSSSEEIIAATNITANRIDIWIFFREASPDTITPSPNTNDIGYEDEEKNEILEMNEQWLAPDFAFILVAIGGIVSVLAFALIYYYYRRQMNLIKNEDFGRQYLKEKLQSLTQFRSNKAVPNQYV
ncbi:uncharacterized protein LOC116346026 [Contarinia nasturtii]|uniref:uncharacterized protein LOC116346026 n=1 Tax=Contarinia nasturtii TaxID=265458 RepID=UPI0012D4743A|nr:uncharacterized protein LOC116346026 [Contarinia nasturtii]